MNFRTELEDLLRFALDTLDTKIKGDGAVALYTGRRLLGCSQPTASIG